MSCCVHKCDLNAGANDIYARHIFSSTHSGWFCHAAWLLARGCNTDMCHSEFDVDCITSMHVRFLFQFSTSCYE